MKYSSRILEEAVNALSSLPSIGKKSALRLVLHLAGDSNGKSKAIVESLKKLDSELKQCTQCFNFADEALCQICSDPHRDKNIVCVVESARDVMAIEDTQQFSGVYHVLGGVISPLDGVGPEDLNIQSLIDRVNNGEVNELVMAISPTIEGDTTIFYISKKMESSELNISTIARGVAFGGELEYADELTLGRSIISRIPYNK